MKTASISIASFFVFGFFILMSSVVFAAPNTDRVPAQNDKSGVDVVIPQHAVQVAEHVFSLGEAIDPTTGRRVEGYAIVHPKSGSKRPGTPGGGTTTSSCYAFLAKGAKWKSAEPWVVDPANGEGLAEASVFGILDASIAKWEDAADGTLDSQVSINIVGSGATSTGFAPSGSMDGINGVRFGSLDAGTIGVTVIWGVFGGPIQGRELVEWDQVYNTFYSWNTDGNPSDMDFESIATHELGHSVGLADLYQPECSEATMYGYGSEGDTKARSLHTGDVAGISVLY